MDVCERRRKQHVLLIGNIENGDETNNPSLTHVMSGSVQHIDASMKDSSNVYETLKRVYADVAQVPSFDAGLNYLLIYWRERNASLHSLSTPSSSTTPIRNATVTDDLYEPVIVLIDLDTVQCIPSADECALNLEYRAASRPKCLAFLKDLAVHHALRHFAIPLLCSEFLDDAFALSSFELGAQEYLIKPLQRPETLWLHTVRKKRDIDTRYSLLSGDPSLLLPGIPTTPGQSHNLSSVRSLSLSYSATNLTALDRLRPLSVSSPRVAKKIVHHSDKLYDCIARDQRLLDLIRNYYSPQVSVDLSSFPSRSNDAALLQSICSWGFNAHEFHQDDLLRMVILMFEETKVFETFGIPHDTFKKFLLAVQRNYQSNPYHNFYHAVDVLQCTYFFLWCSQASTFLRPIDHFALLVAAYCHDVGHPGFNNFFMVNAKSPLALLYNDKSVLESYHAMMTFSILEHPEFHFLRSIRNATYSEFRNTVLSAILATDMACHFDYIVKIKERTARVDAGLLALDNASDRALLSATLIKCADISNAARPFAIAKHWADVLLIEFFAQGDLEKRLGFPVYTYADRKTVVQPKSQTDFISFVVEPLFNSIQALVPGMAFCSDYLKSNRIVWQAIEDALKADPNAHIAEVVTEHTYSGLAAPRRMSRDQGVISSSLIASPQVNSTSVQQQASPLHRTTSSQDMNKETLVVTTASTSRRVSITLAHPLQESTASTNAGTLSPTPMTTTITFGARRRHSVPLVENYQATVNDADFLSVINSSNPSRNGSSVAPPPRSRRFSQQHVAHPLSPLISSPSASPASTRRTAQNDWDVDKAMTEAFSALRHRRRGSAPAAGYVQSVTIQSSTNHYQQQREANLHALLGGPTVQMSDEQGNVAGSVPAGVDHGFVYNRAFDAFREATGATDMSVSSNASTVASPDINPVRVNALHARVLKANLMRRKSLGDSATLSSHTANAALQTVPKKSPLRRKSITGGQSSTNPMTPSLLHASLSDPTHMASSKREEMHHQHSEKFILPLPEYLTVSAGRRNSIPPDWKFSAL